MNKGFSMSAEMVDMDTAVAVMINGVKSDGCSDEDVFVIVASFLAGYCRDKGASKEDAFRIVTSILIGEGDKNNVN